MIGTGSFPKALSKGRTPKKAKRQGPVVPVVKKKK